MRERTGASKIPQEREAHVALAELLPCRNHPFATARATGLARALELTGGAPVRHRLGAEAQELRSARKRELFSLLVQDIDFDAGVVHFRPNEYYGDRKSSHAVREVPLWPQLRTLLVPVVGQRPKGLLFHGMKGRPISDVRAAVAEAFKRAKLPKPRGKEWHLFRHTYTAVRIQTLDEGAPVSLFTVAKELGHGSITLIEQTYGHLLKERAGQRLDRVEYRPLKMAKERTA